MQIPLLTSGGGSCVSIPLLCLVLSSVLLCVLPPVQGTYQCPVPRSPHNGRVHYSGLGSGSSAHYYCDSRYQLVGSSTAHCGGQGTWSSATPTCQAPTTDPCPPLPPVPHASSRVQDYGSGQYIFYTCHHGYQMAGRNYRACFGKGVWLGSPPVCRPIQVVVVKCPDPGSLANGGRTISSDSIGGTVSYYCSSGYQLVGSRTRSCVGNGRGGAYWEGTTPRCDVVVVKCPDPGSPANGGRTISSDSVGGSVSYYCSSGYQLVGGRTRSCVGNGRGGAYWEGTIPRCDADPTCADPGALPNGGFQVISRAIGGRLVYHCNAGYTRAGDDVRICQRSGSSASWSGTPPTCRELVCATPESTSNGGRDYTSLSVGSKAIYHCSSGYELQGDRVRVCQSSLQWQPAAPTCERIVTACAQFAQPANGDVTYTDPSFSQGTIASFRCSSGYVRAGQERASCLASGQWSASAASCQSVTCPTLSAVANADRTVDGDYTPGTTVIYVCHAGYGTASGSLARRCLGDGSWTGSQPSCSRITCPSLSSVLNAQDSSSGDRSVGSKVSYSCNSGYRLSGASSLTCASSGQWDRPRPSCSAIQCTYPGAPGNGFLNPPTQLKAFYGIGESVAYACQSSYRLEGSASVTCLGSGLWSSAVPTCALVVCTNPGQPSNGFLASGSLEQYTVNSRVTFSCSRGFRLEGSSSTVCQQSGIFSASLPSCEPLTCGDPGTPSNGASDFDDTIFESVVRHSCNNGYRLQGDQTRTCQASQRWSGLLPVCVFVDCGDPGNIQNGRRSLQGTKFSQTVTYQCNTGYELAGSQSRTCQASGLWSESQPSCSLVDCGDPGDVENARRSLQLTTYRSTVTYECNRGHRLVGARSRSCGANKQWSSSEPSCQVINCGSPPSVSSGSVVFSATGMDARAVYNCDRGFSLQGSSVRTCQDDQQWSAQAQDCVIVNCGSPALLSNGRVTVTTTTFGAQAALQCNSGFSLEGQSAWQCQENGLWSSSASDCVPVECGDPGSLDNGHRELLSRTVDSRAVFRCRDGYQLVGDEFRTCGSDGEWSGSVPTCELVECGDPGEVPNSRRTLSGVTYGSTVEYVCSRGYVLAGLRIRTCQKSGEWSGASPTCRIVNCGDPGEPANGFKNSTLTTFGTVVEFSCQTGYSLQGSQRIQCGSNAMWSGSTPSCEVDSCPDPGRPAQGSRTLSNRNVGSLVTYSCNRGYRINGVSSRLCLVSGSWTGAVPECTLVDCGDPGEPSNGQKIGSATTFGSEVRFQCNSNFELDGNERRVCQQNGRWSGFLPRCVIGGCGDPGQLVNGRRQLSGTAVGASVSYSCSAGFSLSGTQFRVCQASGSWSGRLPQCTRIDCGDPGTPSNGELALSDSTNFRSLATYSCSEGYRLEGAGSRTCLAGAIWSGAQPLCVSSGCGDPGAVSDGNILFSSSFEVFSTATITCSAGFVITGSSSRVCLSNGLWSAAQPECQLVTCGQLDPPTNGRRNQSSTTFNSEVTYSCNQGYSLSGLTKRTCAADGKWSGSTPTCDPVDCGDPGRIQNGNRELLLGTVFRSTVVYSCSFGFEIQGSTTRTCQPSGEWSTTVPTCAVILCPDPGSPSKGARTLTTRRVNTIVTYSCDTGYLLEGSASRACQESKLWTGNQPTCKIVDCGQPEEPSQGSVQLVASATTFGAVAAYSCGQGYRLQGVQQRTCQANSHWSSSVPLCIRNNCGNLPSISNGNRRMTGTVVGSEAVSDCNSGFQLQGSATRVCQSSTVWSGAEAVCRAINCGDPGTPRNGRFAVSGGTTFGAEIRYECNEGFVLEGGSETRECGESGWSGSLPSCRKVDCGDPGSLDNGGRVLASTLFESIVRFFCDRGYVLNGSSQRVCGSGGQWSGSQPTCVVVTCGDPGTVSNGERELANRNFGATVTFSCDEGYTLEGSSQRACQANGEWSNQVPDCRIVDCKFPGEPPNGDVTVPRTTFGATATYQCDDGYEIDGQASRRCQANGQWAGSVPNCDPIDCGKPSEPRNGRAIYVRTVFKSSVRYACNQGYELSGIELSVCQAGGSYSGSVPTCTPVDCGDLTLLNGEVQLSSGTTLNSVATHSCDSGYQLSGSSRRTCGSEGAWSALAPTCVLVDCGDPGTPARGSRSPSAPRTTFSSRVEYSCDAGHQLSGSERRTCQASGQWSGDLPLCAAVDCGDPEKPDDGDRRVLSTTFESIAHYECDRGFQLNGRRERSCQANGQWSGSVPECQLIDCGNLDNPTNGQVALLRGATTLGAPASYTCSEGYSLSSSVRRTCQHDSTWSGSAPTCSLVDCGDPGSPSNGFKLGSNTKFQGTVLYKCNSGYALLGNMQRRCQGNGKWSGSLPSCNLVDCGDPGRPDNGYRTVPNFKYQSVVTFLCNTGFEISGPRSRTCMANGRWSQTLAECVVVTCGDPGTVSNGERELANRNFGTTATFSCDEGYTLEGSSQRVCQANGEWSNQVPDCRIVDCGDPGNPLNGNRVVSATTFGSTATYQCDSGYVLDGSGSTQCQANRRWSGAIPACRPVDCGGLRNPTNAIRVLTSTTLGAQVLYLCDAAFQLEGAERRTCEASGAWSGSEPSCTAIQCADPGEVDNGGRQLTGRTVGSTVTYSCDTGYALVGIPARSCLRSQRWTGSLPTCRLLDCGDPGSIANGARTQAPTTYLSRVTFSCNSGYTLQGEESRQCQANRRWSGVLPSCVPVDCRDPGRPDNGDRVLLSTRFGASVLYSCDFGFRLEGSEKRSCLASGAWSSALPQCVEVDCGDSGEPDNGSRKLIGSGVNGAVQYFCNRGYVLDGDASRVCQLSGTWTGSVPTCTIVDCSDPGNPPNSQRTLTTTTFGSTVAYTCLTRFVLDGSQQRTCLPTGRWSNSLPRCRPSDCGEPEDLVNGRVDFSSTSIGSTAAYRCAEGYRFRGVASAICQASGRWSLSVRECSLVSCGDPGRVLNSLRLGTVFAFRSTVMYKCNTGYLLRGSTELTCGASGSWSAAPPTCQLVDCGDPGEPANGFKTGSNYEFRSIVTYSCAPGHQLSGPSTRACQANLEWSGTLPRCVEVSCGDPGTPANGSKELSDGESFRSEVRYSCDPGYQLRGDRTRVCHASQSWTGQLPTCQQISCGDPGEPTNGRSVGSDFTFRSTVRFTCNEGYRINGREEIRCLATGEWSHPRPHCLVVQCQDPGRPSNSRRTLTSVLVKGMVTYECFRGYQLVGTSKRTCQSNGQWNGTQPLCRVLDCGSPDVPARGMILSISGSRYGSVVVYKCSTGHRISGSSSRQCSDGGRWTGAVPECQLVDCRDPGPPENGARALTSTTFNSVVTYQCNMGYTLRGVTSRTCESDGRWSQTPPTCVPVDCGDPGSPPNAIRTRVLTTTFGSRVEYRCEEGFRLEGQTLRECLKTGQWSPLALPSCVPTTCEDPGTLPNGKRTLQSLSVDSIVSYYCLEGYRLVGTATRTCTVAGSWTGQLPLCQVVDCGDPSSPPNGLRELTSTTFGSSVTYTCSEDYRLEGQADRRCLSSGHWSGSLPRCTPVDCGDPRSPPNGHSAHQGTTVGVVVIYSCSRGYTLVGNPRRTCLNSALWSGAVPECRIVDCGTVNPPSDGRVSFTATVLKSALAYSCSAGFVLEGGARRVCQEGGQWSGSAPACRRVDCGHPGHIARGSVTVSSTLFGGSAVYGCASGFTLSGPARRECQTDRSWSNFQPVCEVVRCDDPGTPSNGRRELLNTTVRSVVRYFCDKGYRLVGEGSRTCQNDGSWSRILPHCRVVDCGDPGTLRFGRRSSLTATTFEASVTYSCNTGYTLHGSSTRHCLDNAQWSGAVPTCRVIDCGSPGRPDSGSVVFSNTTYLSIASYACGQGLRLVGRAARQCQLSGLWSDSVPACQRTVSIQCPSLPRPTNGVVTVTTTTPGSHATYSCNRDYILTGDTRRVCRNDGQWSGSTPTCTGLTCGHPDRVSFGDVFFTSTSLGSTAVYSCRVGYRRAGQASRTCQENGRWSGTSPVCQLESVATCSHLTSPANGNVIVVSNRVGGAAVYTCSNGFSLVGQSVLTCKPDGQWSFSPPICHRSTPTASPVHCPEPGRPANGNVGVSSRTLGGRAQYSCNHGYLLEGKNVRICLENGQWSGSVPFCRANTCGDPGAPANGRRVGSDFSVGSVVVYVCRAGHALVGGDGTRECLSSRSWSGALPSCQRTSGPSKSCAPPPTLENGRFIIVSDAVQGSLAYYQCFDGFELRDGPNRRVCQPDGSFSGSLPRCVARSASCNGSGAAVDACGRRCTCQGGVLRNCQRVRRDFLSLTSLERVRYLYAVKLLSASPLHKPLYDALVKKFAESHTSAAFDDIPALSQFLPWFRYFLVEYEYMLQSVDCRLTVPTWDWTSAPGDPYSSAYFDNFNGFGDSADNRTQCVQSGPFRAGVWSVTPSAGGGCLVRDYKSSPAFPTTQYIQNSLLGVPADSFNVLHSRLKLVLYDGISCAVGGTMCGEGGPNDPLLLLLAARIDAIFDQWQKTSPAHLATRFSTDNTTLICTTGPVSDYHDNSNLPNQLSVVYSLPIRSNRRRRRTAEQGSLESPPVFRTDSSIDGLTRRHN